MALEYLKDTSQYLLLCKRSIKRTERFRLMLMVMTVRIAAVIMHAPGKPQQKKGKHINAEIIKILSDSLFVF